MMRLVVIENVEDSKLLASASTAHKGKPKKKSILITPMITIITLSLILFVAPSHLEQHNCKYVTSTRGLGYHIRTEGSWTQTRSNLCNTVQYSAIW